MPVCVLYVGGKRIRHHVTSLRVTKSSLHPISEKKRKQKHYKRKKKR